MLSNISGYICKGQGKLWVVFRVQSIWFPSPSIIRALEMAPGMKRNRACIYVWRPIRFGILLSTMVRVGWHCPEDPTKETSVFKLCMNKKVISFRLYNLISSFYINVKKKSPIRFFFAIATFVFARWDLYTIWDICWCFNQS